MKLSAVIPTRFLTIIFHLLLLIIILQEREEYIKAGLPLDYNEEEYRQRDTLIAGGLIAGISLTCFEMLSFFSGVSMFASFTSLISISCHAGASITLAHLILEKWDAQYYWLVFGFCSILPSFIEAGVLVSVTCFQRSLD